MSLSPPPVQSPVDRTASGALAPSQKQADSPSTTAHQPHNPHPQTSEQRAKFGLAITPVWLQWFNALYTFLTTTIPATYLTITSAAATYLSAANIHAAASKATPVDTDEIPLLDSASSFSITRLTWANLKATLVAYLSALTTTWALTAANASSLLNTASTKLPKITCAQASNALTVAMVSQYMDFRNTTLATGTPITLLIGTPANLVIPATSNLGMLATTVSNRLAVLLAYNTGTPVLCIVNLAGGIQLDEANLISPTTIGASSNTTNVIYSAVTCAASSPYKVVCYIDAVFTTGTGWSSPTLVQPCDDAAMFKGSGSGQTWQNVLGSRASATPYYNNTGKGIKVSVHSGINAGTGSTITVAIDNGSGAVNIISYSASFVNGQAVAYFDVPAGAKYTVTPTYAPTLWAELR